MCHTHDLDNRQFDGVFTVKKGAEGHKRGAFLKFDGETYRALRPARGGTTRYT